MILSLSEYVALRVGIAVRPEPGQLWWSAVLNDWQAEESNSSAPDLKPPNGFFFV